MNCWQTLIGVSKFLNNQLNIAKEDSGIPGQHHKENAL